MVTETDRWVSFAPKEALEEAWVTGMPWKNCSPLSQWACGAGLQGLRGTGAWPCSLSHSLSFPGSRQKVQGAFAEERRAVLPVGTGCRCVGVRLGGHCILT